MTDKDHKWWIPLRWSIPSRSVTGGFTPPPRYNVDSTPLKIAPISNSVWEAKKEEKNLNFKRKRKSHTWAKNGKKKMAGNIGTTKNIRLVLFLSFSDRSGMRLVHLIDDARWWNLSKTLCSCRFQRSIVFSPYKESGKVACV